VVKLRGRAETTRKKGAKNGIVTKFIPARRGRK